MAEDDWGQGDTIYAPPEQTWGQNDQTIHGEDWGRNDQLAPVTTDDPRNPYGQSTQPESTSLGAAARGVARAALPVTSSILAGGAAGARLGAVAGWPGAVAGTLIGGGLAAYGTTKLQDEITDTLGLDSPESRERDATSHPYITTAAELVPAAATLQFGAIGKTLGEKLANRVASGGALGLIDIVNQGIAKGFGNVDPTQAAIATGAGAAMPTVRPWARGAIGEALGGPTKTFGPQVSEATEAPLKPAEMPGGLSPAEADAALKMPKQNPAPGPDANEGPGGPGTPLEQGEFGYEPPGPPPFQPEPAGRSMGEFNPEPPSDRTNYLPSEIQETPPLTPEEVEARRAELAAKPPVPLTNARGRPYAAQAQNLRAEEPISENFGERGVGGQKENTPLAKLPFAEEAEPLEGTHEEITPRAPRQLARDVRNPDLAANSAKPLEDQLRASIQETTPAEDRQVAELKKPRSLSAATPESVDWRSAAAGDKLGLVSRLRSSVANLAPIKLFKMAFDPASLTEKTKQFALDVRQAQGTTNKQTLNYTKLLEPFNKEAQRAPADLNEEWLRNYQRGTLPADHPYAPMQRAAQSVDFAYDQRLGRADPDGDMQRFWLPKLFENYDQAKDFVQNWTDSGRTSIPKLGDFMEAGIPFRQELLRKSDLSPDPIKVMQNLHNFYDAFLERNKIIDLALERGSGPVYDAAGPGLVELPSLTRRDKPLYATPEVAMMWERYFGPHSMDPFGKDFLTTLQRIKNNTTAFQLLGGGYHMVSETTEAIVGDVMRAITQAAAGRGSEAFKKLAGAPLAPVRQPWTSAAKGRQAYYDYESATPEIQRAVKELVKGGLTPERIARYTPEFNMTQNFFQSWGRAADDIRGQFGRGEYGGATKDTFGLIGKGMQSIMHPLFNVYIPRLKFGAALEQMVDYIAANPDKPQLYQKMATKILKSIDDRLGELNQSTLFWNRTLKTTANLLMVSPGWETGTIRAPFGGIADLIKSGGRSLSITSPDFSPNSAWPFAFAITTAAVGAIYQFLKTGEMPKDSVDPFFPRTGGTKKGEPERAILPGYLKDIYSWWHGLTGQEGMTKNAASMLYNKLAAVPKITWDTMADANFAGKQIYNPSDPLHEKMRQYLSYVQNTMMNIAVKQGERAAEQQAKGSKISTPEAVFGIKQAPSTMAKGFAAEQTERNNKAAAEAKRFHRNTGYAAGGGVRPPILPGSRDIDERPEQARKNIEGAMKNLGTVEDPDLSGGWKPQEHENWQYMDEDNHDPTPGRRSRTDN